MPRDYRDHFHRLSKEEEEEDLFVDQRDSLSRLYFSLIPFLFTEYVLGRNHILPHGLVCPIGFLLFWSFYYTYYQPSFLENHLGSIETWNVTAIPVVLLGVTLWFIKYTVIEILHFVLLRWIFTRPPAAAPPPKPKMPPPPPPLDEVHWRDERTHSQTKLTDARAVELARALELLGLHGDPSIDQIHQRYRELAKLFHPDLNPDVTDFGRRFIQIDQAYRLLAKTRR